MTVKLNRRKAMCATSLALGMALATEFAPCAQPVQALAEESRDSKDSDEVETFQDVEESPDSQDGYVVEESSEQGNSHEVEGSHESQGFQATGVSQGFQATGVLQELQDQEDPQQVDESQDTEVQQGTNDAQGADDVQDADGTQIADDAQGEEELQVLGADMAFPLSLEVQSSGSGRSSISKPSIEEQMREYERLTLPLSKSIWSVLPNIDAYTPGTLTSQSLSIFEDYINLFRQIAGLDSVRLTDTLNASASEGALILARLNAGITHDPGVPSGVSSQRAQAGQFACKHSNLTMRYETSGWDTLNTISGQMDDADENMDNVGHRRWLLNPGTRTMGVGVASHDMNELQDFYAAVRAFGDGVTNDTVTDYDYIAWPPSGDMLSNLFPVGTPWSVTLNPERYSTPDLSDVVVQVTRDSDGRTWTFNRYDNTGSLSSKNEYFNVDTSYRGIPNCIIFNPAEDSIGSDMYEGEYEVEVSGLKTASGQPTKLRYATTFTIDPTGPSDDTPSEEANTANELLYALKESQSKKIVLGGDMVVDFALDLTADDDVEVTIDCAGHTITLVDGGSLTVSRGKVTLKNGSIVSNNTGCVTVDKSGAFVAEDLKMSVYSGQYPIIYAADKASVTLDAVELKPAANADCITRSGNANVQVKFADIYTSYPETIKGYVKDGYKLTESADANGAYHVQGNLSDKTTKLVSVRVSPDTYTYTGNDIVPDNVYVYFDGKNVTSECTFSYADNHKVGIATVTVKPKSTSTRLIGSTLAEFKIVDEDTSGSSTDDDETTEGSGEDTSTTYNLSKATITLSSNSFTYDGTTHEPTVTVKVDGKTVSSDDYTVAYRNNRDAGTATVTVKAKSAGDVTGSKSATFTIKRKEAKVTANNASKKEGDSDPTLNATVTGTVGSDTISYTLTRESGETAGKYTITPEGSTEQGNYTVTFQTGTLTINASSKSTTSTTSTTSTKTSTSSGTSDGGSTNKTSTTGSTSSNPSTANTSATSSKSSSSQAASTPSATTVPASRVTASPSSVTPKTGDPSFAGHTSVIAAGAAALVAGLVARMRARKNR